MAKELVIKQSNQDDTVTIDGVIYPCIFFRLIEGTSKTGLTKFDTDVDVVAGTITMKSSKITAVKG